MLAEKKFQIDRRDPTMVRKKKYKSKGPSSAIPLSGGTLEASMTYCSRRLYSTVLNLDRIEVGRERWVELCS